MWSMALVGGGEDPVDGPMDTDPIGVGDADTGGVHALVLGVRISKEK